jgi:type IV pilus assembly protein PilB
MVDPRGEIDARLQALSSQQEERLAQRRAEMLQLPYISLAAFPMDSSTLALLPPAEAQAAGAVLFYKKGHDARVGAVNPGQEPVKELVKRLGERLGMTPELYVISHRSLKVALSRYTAPDAAAPAKDEMLVSQRRLAAFEEDIASFKQLGERLASVPPSEILSTIVGGALKMRASDIHIEPGQHEAQLRYRIDGVLQDITTFAKEGWRQILSRVKSLSSLKLNIRSTPQDGSFVLRVDGDVYDVRVSVLPGGFGENIVMRLLSRREASVLTLADLGMKKRDHDLVLQELSRSTGMVVSAGPTGSGKTTTIAACLRHVNKPELKIISLEDPIEYRIPGIEQTEVNNSAGYTFAVGLRSILRQDPDIIFVGEMRDAETAETSVHAAMTGHLVFSTIHANDAPGVIPRLIDIGIKPYVLAPALNLVISQRLVREVCKECREEYVVPADVRKRIREVMQGVAPDVFAVKLLDDPKLTFVRARGCSQCGGTGYQGRAGIFEVFAVTGELEELILRGADSRKIRAAAIKQGMTTLAQDAYLKAIEKVTTIEEVKRVSEE